MRINVRPARGCSFNLCFLPELRLVAFLCTAGIYFSLYFFMPFFFDNNLAITLLELNNGSVLRVKLITIFELRDTIHEAESGLL
jgi:hypothetical protein